MSETQDLIRAISRLTDKIDNINTDGDRGGGGGGGGSGFGIFKGAGGSDKKGSFKDLTEDALMLKSKLDAARASFSSFTGLASEGMPALRKYSSAVRGLGIDYETSAENFKKLVENVPDFLSKSQELQTQMGIQSARLNKLGIDFETNAKNMTTMTKTLGIAEEKAMDFNGTLVKFAQSLKQPPQVIFRDYGAALPKLIQFGDKAPKIFMQASVYAQKLKIDLGSLVDQMSQFDTFEDAAKSAGELNVVLGQNLFASQDLLLTEPGERIELIVDKLQEYKNITGKSFNDLDLFAQKQAARSARIDLETLKKLSGLSAAEAKELAARKESIDMQADGSVALKKAAANAVTMVDRLSAKKDQLVGLTTPFLDLEKALAGTVEKLETNVKLITGIATNDAGIRKALTAEMSIQASDMLVASAGLTDVEKNLMGMFNDVPVIGKAFEKLMPIVKGGIDQIVIYDEEGYKTLLNKRIGNKTFASLAGITGDDIERMQKNADRLRDLYLSKKEGAAIALGLPTADAAELRQSELKTQQLLAETSSRTIDIALGAFDKFKETLRAEMEKKKKEAEDTGVPYDPVSAFIAAGAKASVASVEKFGKDLIDSFDTSNPESLGGRLMERINAFKTAAQNAYGTISGALPANVQAALQDTEAEIQNIFKTIQTGKATGIVAPAIQVAYEGTIDFLKGIQTIGQGASTAVGAVGTFTSAVASAQGTVQKFNSTASTIAIPTPSPASLKSLQDYKNLVDNLKDSMKLLQTQSKTTLTGLKFDNAQAENMKALGDSMEKYAKALEKIKTLKTDQDKLMEVIKALGSTLAGASIKVNIDEDALGTKIGTYVYRAVTGK